MIKNKFAERLKELREEKGLSQTELGRVLNFSQATIAKWEAGTREPNLDNVMYIAKFYNVIIDYLLGATDF